MTSKLARAEITPIRQRTQYTCMGASLSMALQAQGADFDEDTVNKVMGCKPMQGASWEQALAAAQHFGMRATLVTPCPMSTLKEWTDRGVAVMIAWNPEGRDWSHASVVFDVTDTHVHVADPNLPDPDETVRIVPREDFLKKWFEKWPDYLVRRPALAIEREITSDGRQVKASLASRVASKFLRRASEIKPFDRGDWMGYAGATAFENNEDPLIVSLSIPDGFRVRGKVMTDVTFIADAEGVEADFSNEAGDEAMAIDRKELRFQSDGMKQLKYVTGYFHNTGKLTPMFKWV